MHTSLVPFFIFLSIALGSCGPKRVQDSPIKKSISEQKTIDPFAALSLDDIRNNIELFDTQVVEAMSSNREVLLDEREARLIDIAIPCGAQLLDQYAAFPIKNNDTVLGYLVSTPLDQIVRFYREHMERLGWVCTCHVCGYEELLVFEKPQQLCSVVLRAMTSQDCASAPITKIVIFYSLRRS